MHLGATLELHWAVAGLGALAIFLTSRRDEALEGSVELSRLQIAIIFGRHFRGRLKACAQGATGV